MNAVSPGAYMYMDARDIEDVMGTEGDNNK